MAATWWGVKLATPNGISLPLTHYVELISVGDDHDFRELVFQIEAGVHGGKLSAACGKVYGDTYFGLEQGSLFALAVMWPWGDSDLAEPEKVYAGPEYHFILYNLQLFVGGLCQLGDPRDWVLSAGIGFWPCKLGSYRTAPR